MFRRRKRQCPLGAYPLDAREKATICDVRRGRFALVDWEGATLDYADGFVVEVGPREPTVSVSIQGAPADPAAFASALNWAIRSTR